MKVFNPRDTAAVISEDGKQVGGQEWADVESTDLIQKLLEVGDLVEVPVVEHVEDPAATATPYMGDPEPKPAPKSTSKSKTP